MLLTPLKISPVAGPFIDQSTIIPVAPSFLDASNPTPFTINLDWQDNSGNEAVFKIERSLDGIIFVEIDTVPANQNNYTDTGLNQDTQYFYRVRAGNMAGNSAYSNIDDETTLPTGVGTFIIGSTNIVA